MPGSGGDMRVQNHAAIGIDGLMDLVLELPGCAPLLSQRGVGIGTTRVCLVRDATRGRTIFQTTISLLALGFLVGFVGVVVNQRVERSIRRNQGGVGHHRALFSDQAVLLAEFHNLSENPSVDLLFVAIPNLCEG